MKKQLKKTSIYIVNLSVYPKFNADASALQDDTSKHFWLQGHWSDAAVARFLARRKISGKAIVGHVQNDVLTGPIKEYSILLTA